MPKLAANLTHKDWISMAFRALMNEVNMAAEHSAIGVTALGKANYAQTAYYYQAFFALGIGLERGAKVALAVDYILDHKDAFPPEKEIRGYKHNIQLLMKQVEMIAEKRELKDRMRLPNSLIHQGIITVLSDFSNNITRYYNLDLVMNNLSEEKYDPVHAWHERVTIPVVNLHYPSRRQQRDEQRALLTERLIGKFTHVRHHSEAGNPINSIQEASVHIARTDYVIPYTRMYVMQIFRFLGNTLSHLGYLANKAKLQDVPFLDEAFGIFTVSDKMFRSRKTWSIYKQ